VAAQRTRERWRRRPGVIDVVCAAGGVVHCSRWCSHGRRRGVHGRKGTCSGGMVAIGRGEEITSAVYHLPCWRLALEVSREETRTGGLRAGNALRVEVLTSMSWWRDVAVGVGGRRKREGGRLFGAPQLGFTFQAPLGSRRQGRCPSQKGSGAEAVSSFHIFPHLELFVVVILLFRGHDSLGRLRAPSWT
jgi:hypothetical protein